MPGKSGTNSSGRELSATQTGKSPRPHVLVVDDEALIRWSLAESLSNAGYHVLEASDRKTALSFFDEPPGGVCVVLLDLRLPDSRDLGLLRHILQVAPACRVIVMTAHGSPEIEAEAVRCGAYRMVGKPFDLNHMVALVQQAAESRPH